MRTLEFSLESEMTPVVKRWMLAHGLQVQTEYASPSGICDLVGVQLSSKGMAVRRQLNQVKPIRSVERLEILERIPSETSGRSLEMDSLRRVLPYHWRTEDFQRHLAWLSKWGYVTWQANGSVAKKSGWTPLAEEIVAVELKLRRITEALHQAYLRRSFATKAYVGLPENLAYVVAESKRAEDFAARGIGLLAVSRTQVKAVIPAEPFAEMQDPILLALCAERFWGKAIGRTA